MKSKLEMKKINANCFYKESDYVKGLVIDEMKGLTLGELANGFVDNSDDIEGGVFAWDGKLNIRPKFQRAYVVENDINWKTNLIHSIVNGRPTGVIYLRKKDDGTYEMVDGQQRLITLLSFINCHYALPMYTNKGVKQVMFIDDELPQDWRQTILNYTPQIMVCSGTEEELLVWFEVINQPTNCLTVQELRNAAYCGSFVEALKRIFSRTKSNSKLTIENGDIMHNISKYYYGRYTSGRAPERQEVLELALDWISYKEYEDCGDTDKPVVMCKPNNNADYRIRKYMEEHRFDDNADAVRNYYKEVIDWVLDIFFHDYEPDSLKGWQNAASQPWNKMYEKYKDMTANMTDEEKRHITDRCCYFIGLGADFYQKSTGIYEWVLRGEKMEEVSIMLQLRAFDKKDVNYMYKSQGGIDPLDGEHYDITELEAHHITPWRMGGLTDRDNLVLISKENHKKLHMGIMTISPEELRTRRDELRRNLGNLK